MSTFSVGNALFSMTKLFPIPTQSDVIVKECSFFYCYYNVLESEMIASIFMAENLETNLYINSCNFYSCSAAVFHYSSNGETEINNTCCEKFSSPNKPVINLFSISLFDSDSFYNIIGPPNAVKSNNGNSLYQQSNISNSIFSISPLNLMSEIKTQYKIATSLFTHLSCESIIQCIANPLEIQFPIHLCVIDNAKCSTLIKNTNMNALFYMCNIQNIYPNSIEVTTNESIGSISAFMNCTLDPNIKVKTSDLAYITNETIELNLNDTHNCVYVPMNFTEVKTESNKNIYHRLSIDSSQSKEVNINNCLFFDISSDNTGGAILVNQLFIDVYIQESQFMNCSVFSYHKKVFGGAMAIWILEGAINISKVCGYGCSSSNSHFADITESRNIVHMSQNTIAFCDRYLETYFYTFSLMCNIEFNYNNISHNSANKCIFNTDNNFSINYCTFTDSLQCLFDSVKTNVFKSNFVNCSSHDVLIKVYEMSYVNSSVILQCKVSNNSKVHFTDCVIDDDLSKPTIEISYEKVCDRTPILPVEEKEKYTTKKLLIIIIPTSFALIAVVTGLIIFEVIKRRKYQKILTEREEIKASFG